MHEYQITLSKLKSNQLKRTSGFRLPTSDNIFYNSILVNIETTLGKLYTSGKKS